MKYSIEWFKKVLNRTYTSKCLYYNFLYISVYYISYYTYLYLYILSNYIIFIPYYKVFTTLIRRILNIYTSSFREKFEHFQVLCCSMPSNMRLRSFSTSNPLFKLIDSHKNAFLIGFQEYLGGKEPCKN